MSSAEFEFWKVYYGRKGFPVDRIEWAVALAGSAQCRAWGARVEPRELVPKFTRSRVNMKQFASALAAMPGAKVKFIPRPDRKKAKQQQPDEEPARTARLLSPKDAPRTPTRKSRGRK